MKEKYFLKKSHVSVIVFLIFGYVSLLIISILVMTSRKDLIAYVFGVLLILLSLVLVMINYYKTAGVYINDNNMYVRGIRKKHLNPKEIKGVVIIESYSAGGKYRGFYPIKDNEGNSLYTAVFVKNITPEMINYDKGDLWFIQKFKQHIVTWSVYSEDAINYLKSIQNTIKIIKR